MTEFLDIPADVILIIVSKQHLDIRSTNNFREVCLQNNHLYYNVFQDLTKNVQKRGVLEITEEKIQKVDDFTQDFKYLKQSALDISIVLTRDIYPIYTQQKVIINFQKKEKSKIGPIFTFNTAIESYEYTDYENLKK